MSARTATHPSPAQLQAFDRGQLSDSAAAAVAKHLETCVECQPRIDAAPEDSFVGRLKAARQQGTPSHGTRATLGHRPTSDADEIPAGLRDHPKLKVV